MPSHHDADPVRPMLVLRDIRVATPWKIERNRPVDSEERGRANHAEKPKAQPFSPIDHRLGVLTPWSLPDERGDRPLPTAATDLERIHGVGAVLATGLRSQGFETIVDVAEASTDALTAVDGIGPVTSRQIRAAARELLDHE